MSEDKTDEKPLIILKDFNSEIAFYERPDEINPEIEIKFTKNQWELIRNALRNQLVIENFSYDGLLKGGFSFCTVDLGNAGSIKRMIEKLEKQDITESPKTWMSYESFWKLFENLLELSVEDILQVDEKVRKKINEMYQKMWNKFKADFSNKAKKLVTDFFEQFK